MIKQGSKVKIVFTMKDEQGNLWDECTENEPLEYTHGAKQIMHVLEQAVEGKKVGESVSITIPPDEAYGHRDLSLIKTYPRTHFEGISDLIVGARFQPTEDPNIQFEVVAMDDKTVTLDGNHPLADKPLTFHITVLSVNNENA